MERKAENIQKGSISRQERPRKKAQIAAAERSSTRNRMILLSVTGLVCSKPSSKRPPRTLRKDEMRWCVA